MNNNFENIIKEKTDDQLTEIFLNANDYQADFIKIVEKELIKRKIPLESLYSIRAKKDEISDARMEIGNQGNKLLIIFSFLASLFGYANPLGGILGIAAGYQYAYSKHKNANGVEFYYYNESTRKYGRWILIVACSVLCLTLIYKIRQADI
jgi:hypothetical protein